MNVTINGDVIEKMLQLNTRREKYQKYVFALLLGTVSGFNQYNITDCLCNFIYFVPLDNEGVRILDEEKIETAKLTVSAII